MLAQGEKPFKLPIPHCWIGSGHGLPSPVIKILGGNRMVQLPTKGVTLQIPEGSSRQLNFIGVLMAREFKREIKCSQEDRKAIWTKLGFIIGRALQEDQRPDKSDVVMKLNSWSRAIENLKSDLPALEAGFINISEAEMAAVGALTDWLAANPEIGDEEKAHTFLVTFREQCSSFGHACEMAAADLDLLKGKPGRPKLLWYRDFTSLLVSLCGRYRLSAKLSRDAANAPSGALYTLACLMEILLPKKLRSPTAEARFSRLKAGLSR
jgi:hypothetical protein